MLSREILPLSHDTIHKCCCTECPAETRKVVPYPFLPSSPLLMNIYIMGASSSISPKAPLIQRRVQGSLVRQGTVTLKPAPYQTEGSYVVVSKELGFLGKRYPTTKGRRKMSGRNGRRTITAMNTNCDSLELGRTYSTPDRGALLMLFVYIILKQLMNEVD